MYLINQKLKKSNYKKSQKVKSASKKDIQAMTNLCIKQLEERNFFKPSEKNVLMLILLTNVGRSEQIMKKAVDWYRK